MGGKDVEAGDRRRAHHLIDVVGVDDDVVDTMAELASHDAEPTGRVALGIHVDDEPAQAELRKVGRHVDGGCGLSHAALLVDDCVDSWQFCWPGRGRILPGLYGHNSRTHVCQRWKSCG